MPGWDFAHAQVIWMRILRMREGFFRSTQPNLIYTGFVTTE